MNFRKIIAVGTASAVLSLGVVASVSAAHNVNASFETGTDPGVFLPLNAVDSTSINGWTVSAGNVDYIGSYWTSSNGNRSIDLTGSNGSAGAISKTISTAVGHTYEVTFDLAGNPDGGLPVKNLDVSAGGPATNYTFDTTGKTTTAMGWASQTFNFTATAASTTLTFTSLDAGFHGPALDNVVITNVLTNKDQCKNNGWKAYANPSFKNQGDCVSYVQSSPNATGNRADNL